MDTRSVPRLAPPGAGLPKVELLLVRWRFGWVRRRRTRGQFTALFVNERDSILELARGCDAAVAVTPVLIDRVRGMEDSSRFWSVCMTLDHLRIVNLAIAGAIRALGRGEMPQGTARTADVKPDPHAGLAALDGFERSCEIFLKCSGQVENLATPLRYAHPWFGPMDAAGWHALAGVHLGIHRRQIERILAALSR